MKKRVQLTIWWLALGLLILVLQASQPSHAAGPWYVAPGGDDGHPCTSAGAPCATINGAIGKASPGDTVYVAVGTYTGTGNEVVLIDKDVTLSGGWDVGFGVQSSMSAVDGGESRRCIGVNGGVTAVIERFVIRDGSSISAGDGVGNNGTLTLNDSTLLRNGLHNHEGTVTLNRSSVIGSASNGIFSERGTVALADSIIRDNGNGGIYSSGTLTLTNSTVRDNSGTGIKNYYSCVVVLNNSTISGNVGGGIDNYGGGTVRVNSSTISGNTGYLGGGIHSLSGSVILRNSILSGNTASRGPDCYGDVSSAGYNLLGRSAGCPFSSSTGDLIDVDPKLGQLIAAPGTPRYYPLLAGSPAIDAGDPSGCADHLGNPLDTDQRGADRVGRCDMGAYEYMVPDAAVSVTALEGTPQHTPPLSALEIPLEALVLDSIGTPVGNVTVTFAAPSSGPSGTFADTGTYTTTSTTNESGVAVATTFTANALEGSYTVTATASGVVTPANYILDSIFWYVSPDGDDGNNCRSKTTECATIDAVLAKDGFFEGDTVLVASGVYTGTGDNVVTLDTDVTLSGGWDTGFALQDGTSAIDGEGVRRGIRVHGCVARLERFVVRNGAAAEGGGISNYGTLTVENSTVSNNIANRGGGIANNGDLILYASTVCDNTAEGDGGGIYTDVGTLALNNSTLSGNYAAQWGGGIREYEGPVILSSSTIAGNSAGSSGGGIDGNATMQNSILAGNTARTNGPDCSVAIESSGYNIIGDLSSCTFVPSTGDLIGVEAELGELLGPPAMPEYHPLLPDSPAVDAGNPAGCTDHLGHLLHDDQRGALRIGRCDIGSYEYHVPGPASSVHAHSGSLQRTPPYSQFSAPFQAVVLDHAGSPVSDIQVTFAAPASGPSGSFTDSDTFTATAVTNDSGIATAPTFTANGLAGSYVVSATVKGLTTPGSFAVSNVGWYVATDGSDAHDCQTATTQCATVGGVMVKPEFQPGDTVLVGNGTYVGTGEEVILLDQDVRLLGGWDTTFTMQSGVSTVDGEESRRGVTVDDDAFAVIERFAVQNGSQAGGCGVHNRGILIMRNSVVSRNMGCGIYNEGILTLESTRISENGEDGIHNRYAILTLNECVVDGNMGTWWAGGIAVEGGPSRVTIYNSTISHNTGHGVQCVGAVVLNNSTISGNVGNGIAVDNCDLSVNNSTISSNTETGIRGPGVGTAEGTATLQNSIIAGNTGSDAPDCRGTIGSSGYNLVGDPLGCTFVAAAGDQTNVDARLGSLEGTPGYHPLRLGSPAINAGNPAGCTDHLGNPLVTDQRGAPRVGRCDIGAYEFGAIVREVFLPIVLRNQCGSLLYGDDFSDPASGWHVGDSGNVLYQYLEGEYRMLLRKTHIWASARPGFKAADYAVAVDVRHAPGAGLGSYGLIFGLSDDWSQFYSFEILPHGMSVNYALYRYSSGSWVPLAVGFSGSIHPGDATNRIKIVRDGTLIQAYANGQLLESLQDSTYTGSRHVGLIASSYEEANVDARFDNFAVYPASCGPFITTLGGTAEMPSMEITELALPGYQEGTRNWEVR